MTKQNSREKLELNLTAKRFSADPRRTSDRAFCLMCQRRVKLLDYGRAAESFKTDAEDIRELAESKRLHRIHNRSGATMICAESLAALFESRQTRRLKPDFLPFNPADFQTNEDI
jgi:hypothetical protein